MRSRKIALAPPPWPYFRAKIGNAIISAQGNGLLRRQSRYAGAVASAGASRWRCTDDGAAQSRVELGAGV